MDTLTSRWASHNLALIPLVSCTAVSCTARDVQLFQTEPLAVTETTPTPAPEPSSSVTTEPTAPATPTPEPHWSELGNELLIDDFEDGNTQGLVSSGWWYPTNDGTSDQLIEAQEPADRPGSTFALHTQGSGFLDWGAFVGLNLGGQDSVFDAEPATALRFGASSATQRNVALRFIQQNNATFQTSVQLDTQWTEIIVRFQDFTSNNPDAKLDPSHLSHLQLFFALEPFDVWLDDFAFVILPLPATGDAGLR